MTMWIFQEWKIRIILLPTNKSPHRAVHCYGRATGLEYRFTTSRNRFKATHIALLIFLILWFLSRFATAG